MLYCNNRTLGKDPLAQQPPEPLHTMASFHRMLDNPVTLTLLCLTAAALFVFVALIGHNIGKRRGVVEHSGRVIDAKTAKQHFMPYTFVVRLVIPPEGDNGRYHYMLDFHQLNTSRRYVSDQRVAIIPNIIKYCFDINGHITKWVRGTNAEW